MRRYLLAELPRVAVRLLVAFGLFGLVSGVPWPPEVGHWIGVGAFAALAATVIVVCGKFLYDTLFYERHWRRVDSR